MFILSIFTYKKQKIALNEFIYSDQSRNRFLSNINDFRKKETVGTSIV